MRRCSPVLSLLFAGYISAAFACGHCVEDRIAAAYDYATVTRAHSAGHYVAFCAIEGDVILDEAQGSDIQLALESIAGVDRGSVKVSVPNASLSFAFDPARASQSAVLDTANIELAGKGLTLSPLRVMEPQVDAR